MDTANKWEDKVIESFSVQMFYLKLVHLFTEFLRCSQSAGTLRMLKTWSPDRKRQLTCIYFTNPQTWSIDSSFLGIMDSM
jgi:hypothetical protein